jgi:hypothetical protein
VGVVGVVGVVPVPVPVPVPAPMLDPNNAHAALDPAPEVPVAPPLMLVLPVHVLC